MTLDSAHKSKWQIGEVVFGIPFLLSLGIQIIIPLSFSQRASNQIFLFVGVALVILSIVIIGLARRELARFRQPTDPGQPTSMIVKTGIFSISRNPLYLGAATLFFGLALTLNNLWSLLTLLLSIIICHYMLIIPEEKYLGEKFGDKYIEYAKTVSRWVGRKRSV